MKTSRFALLMVILLLALPVAVLASVAWGSASGIGIGSLLNFDEQPSVRHIVMNIRLPRALVAILVGAALSIAGCALQGLFRNPLAEPGILGVSSGGAFGAVMAIFFMMPLSEFVSGGAPAGRQTVEMWVIPVAAFIGSLVSSLAVFVLSTTKGRTPLATLLLAGIAMNALLSAAVSFMLTLKLGYYDSMRQIIYWLIGGLNDRTWTHVKMALPPILLCGVWLQFMARDLNSISLGEETASTLGVSVQRLKIQVLVLVSVLTGVSVAVSGVLAFVGLVIPQLFRLFSGPDHRKLLPLSAVGGALFLVVVDLISRTIIRPEEIRIGILTSLIGGPFFLFLLLLNRMRGRIS